MQCGAPVVCVVAKAWNEQVEHVLEATLEQNLDMITETVEYLVANGREVMVDLEHFYDGCVASGYRGQVPLVDEQMRFHGACCVGPNNLSA